MLEQGFKWNGGDLAHGLICSWQGTGQDGLAIPRLWAFGSQVWTVSPHGGAFPSLSLALCCGENVSLPAQCL